MPVELRQPEPIENLRNLLLNSLSQNPISAKGIGKPELMLEAVQRVRETFDNRGNAAPSEDRILKATEAFLQTQGFQDPNQARFVAWGLAVPHVQNTPLLDMDEPFSRFISEIREIQERDITSIKMWRALLSSYFRHSGLQSENAIAKANWDRLRVFLKNSFPSINQNRKQKPAWMNALTENLNLLDTNPCEPYAQQVLEGNTQIVNELQADLSIPETSWFVIELVKAQIHIVCSYEEPLFKANLFRFCEILRNHPLCISEGLERILTHYNQCVDRSEHAELSRLAVDHWGNPKLPRSTGWGLVSPEVKGMVLKWFISKDLRIFFDHFGRDHDADQDHRRFRFWMHYLDQIHDAYFALGPQAYHSQQEDYCEVRRGNEGRILRLERGGTHKNNAFIMLIGRYAIVEFGTTGNACFCYDLDNLPFPLGHEFVNGDRSHLKNRDHPGCIFRREHRDRPTDWEDVFEQELGGLGIYPDSHPENNRSFVQSRPEGRQHQYPLKSAVVGPNSEAFNIEELKGLARPYKFTVTDHRSRGGYLTVTPDINYPHVVNLLTRWGFCRRPGWGWWLP